MAIEAYIMRHGSTDISPQPEGWKQVGLNVKGWREARQGAQFMLDFTRVSGPKPTWGISSDLVRAFQTLAVVASILQIPTRPPAEGIRAFEINQETPAQYEHRSLAAFESLLEKAKQEKAIPLIVCHRSSTAFLGQYHKELQTNPDYTKDALLHEGGIMAITSTGLMPLFRAIKENWSTHGEIINVRS